MNDRAPVLRFAPRRDQALATGILGLVAAAAVALTDGPGRFLLVLAALLLVGTSVTDLLWVPRLTVSADGLVVNTPSARLRLAWSDLDAVRLDERSRLGRTVTSLELDADERLVVFGRHSLGQDVSEAHALIAAFDPRG